MTRGRQKGVWYIGFKRKRELRKRRQRGGVLPLAGLLGAAAGPIIGQIAQPLLKKFIGGRRRRRWDKTHC